MGWSTVGMGVKEVQRTLEGCRKGQWTLERLSEPLGSGSMGQVPVGHL